MKTSLERYAELKDQSRSEDAPSVDFLFLLLGMITTLMAFLLLYSLVSTPPNTSRALAAATSGDATEEVNATDDEEFDQLLEGSDATQLSNILTGLNRWSAEDGPDSGIKANQRRVDAANHMLTKKLSKEQRKLAVTSKLNALTTIYGFGLLGKAANVAESLRDTANTYVDSPEPEIKKLARLSLFKVNAFEMTKEGNEPAVTLLVNDIAKLLHLYPNDETVLATIDMVIEYYRQKVDRVVALRITQGLEARKGEFKSPEVLQLLKDFSDETLLNDARYTQLFENRWIDGARGQRELLKQSIQLAAEPSSGTLLVKSVDSVAHWFEQDDQYENAVSIYEEVLRSVDTYQSPEVAALAKKRAQDGIERSKIVGEKIDLSGFLLTGQENSPKELEGKVVLVVFWSAFEPKSNRMLLQIAQAGKNWRQRGIRILGVNVDRTWDLPLIQGVVKPITNVTFLFGNSNDNYSNNILKQCPSDSVPRLMLIGKDGRVADINVPQDEVATQLDLLVGRN